MEEKIEVVELKTDILIIGGGAAGCMAAITVRENAPDLDVMIVEKAHIDRSGCLAAGINAINAYLNPGETPESFLAYVKKDAADVVRDDLVLSIAQGLNEATDRLDAWGLPIQKDEDGSYVPRGKRSVRINGERFKPIIARAAVKSGAKILNRIVVANYIVVDGLVAGAYGFGVRDGKFYILRARAVICATGGAAGIYRSNNHGEGKNRVWYPPFNVGSGLAMGIRAGAEMTSFEMRFIALRVKDIMSPTGTLAQGVHTPQINAFGEKYLKKYTEMSTPMRLKATLLENQEGRGPCYLDTTGLTDEQAQSLKEAYLNMSPGMVLFWADHGVQPNDKAVEITGSEPYVVGGHGSAGYWVDTNRATNVKGLFAAGDVVGCAPKKYATGCMVEGKIAAETAIAYVQAIQHPELAQEDIAIEGKRVFSPLMHNAKYLRPEEVNERLQKIMDEYAGGISQNYAVTKNRLLIARSQLDALQSEVSKIGARDLHELMQVHEVIDKIYVARALVEHLLFREETRWPCYQTRLDYPARDDENWLGFVNSVYVKKNDQFIMFYRDMVGVSDEH